MKMFAEPAIKVEIFAVEDVVTTSTPGSATCPNEMPDFD